tara:strand:- start:154 stop:765 length:612 start_codon:yes stop_codon:yes gene_type:complete
LKKNKISKNWINKQRRDIYVRKSKIEGYRSRAVYKLEEINNKFKFLKNGLSVVDLGAAPGSWSQYMSKNYKKMKILAIDLKKIDKIDNIFQLTGDFTEKVNQKKIKEYFNDKVDLVVSDMAANTSGNKNLDSIVTGELCLEALEFTKNIIKKDGQFVSKLFMGTTFNEIVKYSKEIFEEINIFKPPASRKDSKENFLVCKKLR